MQRHDSFVFNKQIDQFNTARMLRYLRHSTLPCHVPRLTYPATVSYSAGAAFINLVRVDVDHCGFSSGSTWCSTASHGIALRHSPLVIFKGPGFGRRRLVTLMSKKTGLMLCTLVVFRGGPGFRRSPQIPQNKHNNIQVVARGMA